MVTIDEEENLRSRALERVSDGIVSFNSNLEYTYINAQAEYLLDATEESVLGKHIWNAFPGGQGSIADDKIQEAIETGQQNTYERYNEATDRWYEVRIYPDEEGISLFFTDISDRKEREKELQKYEQALELLPITVGINTPGEDGSFDFINQAAVSMFDGESKSDFQDLSPSNFYLNPDERKRFSEQLEQSDSIERYETKFGTLEDETFWGAITAEIKEIQGDAYIIGVIEDISERKQRRQELETSEARFRALTENAPFAVITIDESSTVQYANNTVKDLFGYTPTELVDRPVTHLLPERVVEENQAQIEEFLAGENDTDKYQGIELTGLDADGTEFPIEINSGQYMANETKLFTGIVRDISERKEAREKIRRERDRLDKFASILSHDIRNPLNVAQGRLDFIEEESNHVEVAQRSLDRIERLVEDILILAREGEDIGETKPVDLGAIAEQCWSTVDTESASLHIDSLPRAEADRNRLLQVFENLYRNAIEHGGDNVTIHVGPTESGFYIEDTGPGIEEDKRTEIFQGGYTTNRDGTGFGLAIVKRIVNAHGWEIRVIDSVDGGARFEITGVDFAAA